MNTNIKRINFSRSTFWPSYPVWKPQMAPYITALIKHTYHQLGLHFVGATKSGRFSKSHFVRRRRGFILGTKQTSSEIIEEEAKRTGMPYINQRWLGGMLTNFKTTCNSVTKLKDLEESIASGTLKSLTKKEGLKLISKKNG